MLPWYILLYPPVLAVVIVSVGGTILLVIYAQYLRNGFRFRLRTLLIAITCIGIALGLIAWAIQK